MDEPSAAPRTPLQSVTRWLLAVAALLLVGLGYYTLTHRGQRQAVRATEALGGRVNFNDGDPTEAEVAAGGPTGT